jgi:phosphoribosylanthranilate isomerase
MITPSLLVKICGVRQPGDLRMVIDSGADAVGVNFWPGSKRYVAPDEAGWLAEAAGRIWRVGVFVNHSRDAIRDVWDRGLIDAVQLHGDEAPGEGGFWMDQGIPVIRALALREAPDRALLQAQVADWLLLDTWKPQGFGGHGVVFPWEWACQARELLPERKLLLAGGLTPENIAEAVREVNPDGVDVASGVESAPGVKDAEKVARFVAEARKSA